MYSRVSSTKDELITLTKNGRIDVFVRFANISNNWASSYDKEIVKAFPKFQELDIDNPKLGDNNSTNIRIKNLYFIGDKVVTLVNAYIYGKKDNRGNYQIDEKAFTKVIKELDENHRARIIGIDFQHDTSYSKHKIIKELNNILKFSKIILSE